MPVATAVHLYRKAQTNEPAERDNVGSFATARVAIAAVPPQKVLVDGEPLPSRLNPCDGDEDCCKDLPTATGVVTYRCCAAPGGQRLCADARSFACSTTKPSPADPSRPRAQPAPTTEDSRCPAGRACGRIAK